MDIINDNWFSEYDNFYNDESDECDNLNKKNFKKLHIIKLRNNYFNICEEKDFQRRFVISKKSFEMLLQKIENKIQYNTNRNAAIPPVIQLLVTLRFYATGCFLITAADFCGISETSAHKIIHRVSPEIAALRNDFIKLPLLSEEIRENEQKFFKVAKFIRVIGCMDCTHIKVESFGGENCELYRNRKGFFSINVQVIINAKLEIIDIVARWPGSTHDSTIFNHSRIKTLFDAHTFGDSLLLADSGYPNLPYLMTPLLHPTTPEEHLYNEAQIRTRTRIERCFGIWKRRFAILSIGMRCRTVENTFPIIIATAVLHNIAQQEHNSNLISNSEQCDNTIIQIQNADLNSRNNNNEREKLILEYFKR
ncbi:putative nuclease HARBI1 [Linepithema humile]